MSEHIAENETVDTIQRLPDGTFEILSINGSSGEIHRWQARNVVIATGTFSSRINWALRGKTLSRMYLGDYQSEPACRMHGVKDKKIVVVGSGNTALVTALTLLERGAKQVTLVFRDHELYWQGPKWGDFTEQPTRNIDKPLRNGRQGPAMASLV